MKKPIKIFPSILSADFSNLSVDIAAANKCGAHGLHCDIMDGHFVPNITFGPMIVKAVRSLTDMALYCHLMIEKPERYIEAFAEAGADEITVHAEACTHLHRVLQQIKDAGARAGVALNPSTPLCAIENVIDDIDVLLIMTVNPGFGGQSFISSSLRKISQAANMLHQADSDADIAVDGGIDESTAPHVVRWGANLLIAGTAVFGSDMPVDKACNALKLAANMGREENVV